MRATVGTGDMSTTRAGLRRIAGIGKYNVDTFCFGFVLHKALELSEGPVVQFSSLFASCFDALSDVGQVLHNDGAASGERLDKQLGYPVILVCPETVLSHAKLFEMSLSTASVFGLKGTAQAEELAGMFLDTLPIEKPAIARDGQSRNPNVYANYHVCWFDNRRWNRDNDMKPESVVGIKHEVEIVYPFHLGEEGDKIVRDGEVKFESSAGGAQTNPSIVEPQVTGTGIVTYGLGSFGLGATCLLALALSGPGRSNGFPGFLSGGDDQLRRQRRMLRTQGIVGLVVEADPVDIPVGPGHSSHVVEAGRIMFDRIS